jgi:Protein of unknown function DUF262
VSKIDCYPLQHSTVLSVFVDRDRIWLDPEYQRQGEIWSLEKRQLLIDSLINRYDIPKLYFHKLSRALSLKRGKDYAVVDGRQRLEALFDFLEGKFALSEDFDFIEDADVKAGNLTYNDLAKRHPRLKQRLDSFTLPIMVVETDELELVEEMFSRLNEAVPLNSAEKRNAFGGEMARTIRDISEDAFFGKRVRFSNSRYQHREVAARLLFLEHCLTLSPNPGIVDTKKPFLDAFTREFRSGRKRVTDRLKNDVSATLSRMYGYFVSKDILLAAQAAVPIYFLLVRTATANHELEKLDRAKFLEFHESRQRNREQAAADITQARFDLLEYDRLSQQGTNDATSIRQRVRILAEFCGVTLAANL